MKGGKERYVLRTKNKAAPRARAICPICQYSWPADYGTDCHVCLKAQAQAGPSAEDKRRARYAENMERFVQRTGGRASDTRTEAINQERIARIRAEKKKGGGDGYHNYPLSDPSGNTGPVLGAN